MLPTKLGSFGQAVSESKNFVGIDQSASRTACGGHVCYELSRKEQSLEDLPYMLPTKFQFLKSLYSDTKILSKYIPSLQKKI